MTTNNVKAAAGFDLAGWLSDMDAPAKEVTVYMDGRNLGRIHQLVGSLDDLKGKPRADAEAELKRLREERARSATVFVIAALSGEESGAIISVTPRLPGEDNDFAAQMRRTTKIVAAATRSITRADGKQVVGPVDDEVMSTMRRVMGGSEWDKLVQAMNTADDGDDESDPTYSPAPSGGTPVS